MHCSVCVLLFTHSELSCKSVHIQPSASLSVCFSTVKKFYGKWQATSLTWQPAACFMCYVFVCLCLVYLNFFITIRHLEYCLHLEGTFCLQSLQEWVGSCHFAVGATFDITWLSSLCYDVGKIFFTERAWWQHNVSHVWWTVQKKKLWYIVPNSASETHYSERTTTADAFHITALHLGH